MTSQKYIVRALEVVDWRITVRAASEEEALEKAQSIYIQNGFDEAKFKYSGSEGDYWEIIQ